MDAWLTRLYERRAPRYLRLWLVALFAFESFVFLPPLAIFPARYEGLSAAQTAREVLITDASLVLALVASLVFVRAQRRALTAWSSGERGAALVDQARAAAFTLPRRFAWSGTGCAALLGWPVAVLGLTLPRHHVTLIDFAEVGLGGLAAVICAGLVVYFAFELAMRPVRASLPAPQLPELRRGGFAKRVLLILLWTTFIASTGAALFVVKRGGAGGGRMLGVFAVALGTTALLAGVIAPLLAGAVIGPIRVLIRGTRAVAGGDLSTPVPVTTSDELGALAASFNDMLDGLRERETLRVLNASLADELRESLARVVAAAAHERRRVERDLHDGAQQQLVLLNLKLGLVSGKLSNDPEVGALLDDARRDLARALADLRELAHGIYPALLESDGLAAAITDAASRAAIPTAVESQAAARYPHEVEVAVYFCCLEALQNAAKHAGPGARATVRLGEREGALCFEIADDGRGFDRIGARGNGGLRNMADRIGALGGKIEIDSALERGTTISGTIPAR